MSVADKDNSQDYNLWEAGVPNTGNSRNGDV